MTLSTAFVRFKTAIAGAAALGLIAAASAPAMAQTAENKDIFIGHFKDKTKPVLVYVFSDATTPALKEVDSAAIFAVPGYKQGGEEFDAAKACSFTLSFDRAAVSKTFPVKMESAPIYGPNAKQDTIDPFTLPSYMARESIKVLIENKAIADEAAATPYFNCAGWLWARLLDQPPAFWNDFLKKKIEETKKSLKK